MKFKTVFICSECGQLHPKWQGQCSGCGKWNTLAEDVYSEPSKADKKSKTITEFSSPVITLESASESKIRKIPTGIKELDRVLGEGVAPGQVFLLAGPPGIGKSTLMLEAADGLARGGENRVLYVSGEESTGQVSSRAVRLGIKNKKISLMSETSLLRITEEIKKLKPALVVVDSIQTVYHPEWPSASGSVTQIRECAGELLKIAKQNSITLFILGHVTKEGDLAGPKILEHMVDTVLYFDSEKTGVYRMLRAHKNRFGAVDELGVFEMTQKGLVSADDYFVSSLEEKNSLAGRAYTVLFEGTRPVLSQVEALVNKSFYPYPRRVFTGIDSNRGQILLAASEKNADIRFDSFDVFASIHGGLKTKDVSADLAFCAAVISSLKNIPLPHDAAFIGEVGILAGIAPTPHMTKRINELERLGFKKVYVSASYREKNAAKACPPDGRSAARVETVKIRDIKELCAILLENGKPR